MSPFHPNELRQMDRDIHAARPLEVIRDGRLTIVDKHAERIHLRPNRAQRRFLNLVEWLWDQGLPASILVHKCRQSGISTIVGAVMFVVCVLRDDQHAMIVADQKEHTENLYDRIDVFDRELGSDEEWAHLTVPRGPAKGRAVHWANGSKIDVNSAESREQLGRSPTLTMAHGSEVAYWPDLAETEPALAAAVKHGRLFVKESTAKGLGDPWHDDVMHLVGQGHRGVKGPYDDGNDGVWHLFFVSWFEHEAYTRPLNGQTLEDAWSHLLPDEIGRLRRDEEVPHREDWLREQGVTEEQLHWRRWTIIQDCRRNPDTFDREYPDTPERAFLGAGDLVFDALAVKRAMEASAEVTWSRGVLEMGFKRVEFRPSAAGWLEIQAKPEHGAHYAIGADLAEGIGQDADSFHVIHREKNELVARANAQMGSEIAGVNLEALCRWYNDAVVCPEANSGFGQLCLKHLITHYPADRVYRREVADDTHADPEQKRIAFGFLTTAKSKRQLIGPIQAAILSGACKVRNMGTLRQLGIYEADPKTGKMSAPSGKHDDDVMSIALAWWAHERMAWLGTLEHTSNVNLEWDTWAGA